MSPPRRRRGASPDPHPKRHCSRSRSRSPPSSRHHRHPLSRSPPFSHRRRRSPSRSPPPSHRPHQSPTHSPLPSRPHNQFPTRSRLPSRPPHHSPTRSPLPSRPPRRDPVFASYQDHPDLPPNLRGLCEILSSGSLSLPSLLDNTGTVLTQSDVETVLRLSYSHPGPSLTFFRWAGERHLNHMHSCYSWNLIVDMLGKNLHFDAMWDAVRSMRDLNLLSLATFASVFGSLASDGRAGEALAAFRAMPMYGIRRDTVALNSLLAALCRVGLLVDGRTVLREAALVGVKPDADSFAILLEGCENEKDAKCARKVFDEMVTAIGWNPINRPAYDSFLVTLLSSLDDGFIEAMRCLEDLHQHGCSPGPKFFRAAFQLCLSKCDIQGATALWEDYIDRGVCPPDTAIYNCIIALSCKGRRPDVAFRYFDEMVLHGAFPDSDTYNSMFQVLVQARKAREAVAILNEMLKNECLPTHTNCLLAFNTKDPELCIKVWKCMLEHGIRPLEEAGNLLVSLLERNLLPEACKYAEDLIDNGVKLSSANLANLKRGLRKIHKDEIHDRLLMKWKQR
ncbi:Pentatricopeptide repeat (PPR) superfamily protein [Rhynchospora pubera]|uniref:Pentatricopeptide repeat (PPR) superfamily protein n=1 Tax=Rhynchospora pubera TaxID=906938 RepID=A0AAV8HUU0_9POAL|nr:Pentatricopeptide repeat (PPR) superfamily protein [Rhynchospora pubera]